MGGEVVRVTMGELSKYRDCMEQVRRDEEILANLRSKAGPSSPTLTGMPHSGGGHADPVAYLAVECAALEEKLQRLHDEAEMELEALEEYISTVSDERAALAMRLRFIRLMPWSEVAECLNLWQPSSARKLVQRYLAQD